MPDKRTVLIADDTAANREYLKAVLVPHGYSVTEAADGETALARVRDEGPDLVICDVLMPRVDGFEFLRRVRGDPAIASLPVIFFTAYYLEGQANDLATAGGVSSVLQKPCEPAALLAAVEEAFASGATTSPPLEDEAYREQHLRLLSDKLASTAIDNEFVNQRLAGLVELNLQLASQQDPVQLLSMVCRGARELVNADHGLLAVTDDSGEQFEHIGRSAVPPDLTPIEPGRGLLGRVWSDKAPERLSGEELDPIALGLPPGYPTFRAMLAVPITSFTRSYGWLCLTTAGDAGFTEEDELLLTILGAQTGRVYENGSLYRKVRLHASQLEQQIARNQRSRRHLKAQFAVAQALATASPFHQVIPDLLRAIGDNLAFSAAILWGAEQSGPRFLLLDAWTAEPELAEEIRQIARGQEVSGEDSMLARVSFSGEPQWIANFRDDARFDQTLEAIREQFVRHDWNTIILLPLLQRGQVMGILSLVNSEQLPYSDSLMSVLTTLSNQVSQFLDNSHHQQHIIRLNRLYALLSGINTAVVRVRSRQRLFRAACRIAVDEGHFRIAWVAQFDERGGLVTPLIASSRDGIDLDQWAESLAEPAQCIAIRQVIESGHPLVANQLDEIPMPEQPFPMCREALDHGCLSAAAFPLRGKGISDGLVVLYADETGFFDEEEIQLLGEMATNVAFAVQYLQNEEQLHIQAFRDALTGLMNRSALYAQLEQLVAANQDSPARFAVVLVDIDNFHTINDTLGHSNGDALLIEIAQQLESCVWESDMLACLGGDHFALVLRDVSRREQVEKVVSKVLELAQASYTVSGIPVNVEISAGTALYPDDGESAETLWRRADIALRQARKRFVKHLFYSPDIDRTDPAQLTIIGGLRDAINQGELVLHYQPKISLVTGAVTGLEALIRWQQPTGELIFPDQFLPSAEQTGLINPLTDWVLRKAVGRAMEWRRKGVDLELSINISVRNLLNPHLGEDIMRVVREARFPLHRLMLEVTESAVMTDPVNARRTLQKLSDAGIQISLDDFGVGHSSLAYLKDLPLQRLKIDKSFVFDILQDRNRAIVSGVIDIAHRLGLSVTAEGVEDREAFDILQSLGCDYAQGYFISRPLEESAFLDWLENYQPIQT
ncbi:EAL domain-containing protein [Parahaliea aestuarii]|uniref:EAL domain-containing protein n=1 Tax=Parahaliea aestuarii TaxID=1852021 RepID=A0A5C9A444_9GAMM|nr:EAL domain-containing protein [Parahaliea aestuarii]TXS94859.1 EAL domain-containing protein [Parahaliea aestuarii]